MKNLLAASVFGLGFVSVNAFAADLPAPVAPPPAMAAGGHQYGLTVDGWGGYYFLGSSTGDADDGGIDEGFAAYGGDAALMFLLSPDILLQLGVQAGANSVGDGDDDQVTSGWQITGHALHQSGLGVFGGGGNVSYEGEDTDSLWFVGGEFRHRLGMHDFLVQGGYLDASEGSGGEPLHSAWFVNVGTSFDLGGGFSFGGHAGYANGESEGEDTNLYAWGASLNYTFTDHPLDFFVAYEGMLVDNPDARADEHLIKVGLKYSLGDLAGDQIDTPDFWRWVGIGQRTD